MSRIIVVVRDAADFRTWRAASGHSSDPRCLMPVTALRQVQGAHADIVFITPAAKTNPNYTEVLRYLQNKGMVR